MKTARILLLLAIMMLIVMMAKAQVKISKSKPIFTVDSTWECSHLYFSPIVYNDTLTDQQIILEMIDRFNFEKIALTSNKTSKCVDVKLSIRGHEQDLTFDEFRKFMNWPMPDEITIKAFSDLKRSEELYWAARQILFHIDVDGTVHDWKRWYKDIEAYQKLTK